MSGLLYKYVTKFAAWAREIWSVNTAAPMTRVFPSRLACSAAAGSSFLPLAQEEKGTFGGEGISGSDSVLAASAAAGEENKMRD